MKNIKTNENTCKNCRYYSQHYSKQGTAYNTVCCGHCLNRNNKKMQPLGNCEYWEDIAVKKEERKRNIIEALIFMSERLDELTKLLKDDIEK
jgi:hypothetical protein